MSERLTSRTWSSNRRPVAAGGNSWRLLCITVAAGLLRFDAGGLDDAHPFVRLGLDVGREFIRRAGDDFHAFRHHPLLQLGRAQAARDFLVELVDDGTRRPGRRQNAEPLGRFVAGQINPARTSAVSS